MNYVHTLKASIMEDGYGKNKNLLYAARAKLDNIGAIKSHSCIVNNPKRLKRTIEKLNLIASIGDAQIAQKREKEKLAAEEVDDLRPFLKKAVDIYTSGIHDRRLEKKFIKAILLFAFEMTPVKRNDKKDVWLDQLKTLDRDDTNNRITAALAAAIVDESAPYGDEESKLPSTTNPSTPSRDEPGTPTALDSECDDDVEDAASKQTTTDDESASSWEKVSAPPSPT